MIPAKSPKESTPGDSDSRNRCNPISAENCTCDMQVYNVTNMHTQMEIVQEFRVQVFIFSVVKAPSAIFLFLKEKTTSGQFISRPQTFLELQLHFKRHFLSVKMQFET